MNVKIFFLFVGVAFFISCEKHVCTCKEYKGENIIKIYDKTIKDMATCEELNTVKCMQGDTVYVICGDSNPL